METAETNRQQKPGARLSFADKITDALDYAQKAEARGYSVKLQLAAPLSVQVIVRKGEKGRPVEVFKALAYEEIEQGTPKILLVTIEECIAELESFLFGEDYLPAIQARRQQIVENACRCFYESLDFSIIRRHRSDSWAEFTEDRPYEANALRTAMQSAMQGSRKAQ